MKKISEIIRKYKEAPSEELKDKIIDYLIGMENPEDLDAVCPIPESDWFEFDHIRVKRLSGSVFAVAEVFGIDTGGYMCYAYKIDLSEYPSSKIAAFESNCEQYRAIAPDEGYFAAASVAEVFDVDDAEFSQLVLSESEKQQWLAQIDRQVC